MPANALSSHPFIADPPIRGQARSYKRHKKADPEVGFSSRSSNQPARRNNQIPASAHTPAGTRTANSGEKPNTRLDGPSRS